MRDYGVPLILLLVALLVSMGLIRSRLGQIDRHIAAIEQVIAGKAQTIEQVK